MYELIKDISSLKMGTCMFSEASCCPTGRHTAGDKQARNWLTANNILQPSVEQIELSQHDKHAELRMLGSDDV
ncbi:hypothetical protein [Mesorhizobium sp. M0496]|uniref:hypothetical protein n=1 Tax=Mesorhizobium sp. M0496 TaxID=2956952 RepID=UPI00333942F0